MQIVNGSKENIVVDLVDATGAVTDLSGASPVFYVEKNDGTVMVNGVAATAVGMRVVCLFNTTTGGPWTDGLYKLYVGLTIGAESPKIYAGDIYLI